jgi:alpha-1,6-mannosyltransferase
MQTLFPDSLIGLYSIIFLAASVAYVLFAFVLRRVTFNRTTVLVLIGTGLAARVAFLPVHPLGSDDIYRYLWDGRVQAAGIDPYAHAPGDSALAGLHTADLPARVNHPSLHSPYLPMTEWIFFASWQIAGEDPLGIKILLLLAECLTLLVLSRLLRHLELPRQNILLYALCPLPVVEFALDAHIDGLGIPLLLLALLLWLTDRRVWSLVALGLSVAIKPVGLVLIPGLMFVSRTWRERAMCMVVPLVTVAIQYVPYLWSSNPVAGLLVFGKDWSYNGPIYELLLGWFGDNTTARRICGVILAAALILLAARKRALPYYAYASVLLLLLFSPVVHPWYIAWLAGLVPLVFAWSGIALLGLASLTSFTLVAYLTTGVWGMDPWLMTLEFVPVFGLFVWEFLKSRERDHVPA